MNSNIKFFFKDYLSNIQVNVCLSGYNWVGCNWKDIDYTPNYNKFYYICNGDGWVKIGDHEYYPKPGQLFLMPAGIKQSYSIINDNPYTKYWCHFTAKIGDKNLFDVIKLPDYICVSDTENIENIFKEILFNFNSVELSASLMLKASILKLISYYLDNSTIQLPEGFNQGSFEMLNVVVEYISNNFYKNITIEELSSIVHLHPNYFIKIFKKHMGTSPIHFLNKRRIDEARLLLASTNLTLAEISSRIGISNSYYFSKLFKEYTGSSPSTYKQLIKQHL